MAGVKLGKNPFTSFFLNTVNCIPINPNSADKNAIKLAIKHLRNNGSVVIFPEGTRSRTGSMIEAKKGFILLVKLAQVPIIPIALEGTEKLLPIDDSDMGSEKPQHSHIKVTVGEPFELPAKSSVPEGSDWEAYCAADAMYKLAGMLSPSYRGIYGDQCL